eukprot:5671894-Amphidinium_carterae.1
MSCGSREGGFGRSLHGESTRACDMQARWGNEVGMIMQCLPHLCMRRCMHGGRQEFMEERRLPPGMIVLDSSSSDAEARRHS